jgi:hypothetical protein
MRSLVIVLLLCGCEGVGELGLKPTEIVMANANKDKAAAAAYVDPYTDSMQLNVEKKNLARSCGELQKKLSVLDTSALPGLDKTATEAITAVNAALLTACASNSINLDGDLKIFSEIAKDAFYLGNDMRMRATDGIDKVTGKVNPKADKFTAAFEAAADLYGDIGNHSFAQIKAYFMYAPLADRNKTADAVFFLIPRLSPDYGDELKSKQLLQIMSAEGDEALRKKIRDEIYGELPPPK